MNRHSYYWVTGLDSRGVMTTAGPYESEGDAEEATSHLSQTDIHKLSTRQHDKARRELRQRMAESGASRGRMASDEPLPERRSLAGRLADRVSGRSREADREFDDD